ncbi:hypothetical protein A2335_00835 [Candidatus Peregrinibacteria bacterium RIFOXYB2_FULL_32_7]|nr:MAG: hypothetical protein A2335_00835 [Candidatus Peregrinibacteria bacterium RIFOXYB2_FULL_32_7]
MKKLVRQSVRNMKLLKWGNVPCTSAVRLMFGENPYVFQPALKAVRQEATFMNFYPDPVKNDLRAKIADYVGKVLTENIFLGNGEDGLIELIAKVFIEEKDEVLLIAPSFPAYLAAIQLMGGKEKYVYLEKDFSLDFDKLQKSLKKTKLAFIANPNNPTGNLLLSFEQIEEILKFYQGILVIDECYFELSKNKSAISLIKKYPNLIVLRSFSKSFGLSGLRIGYAIADKEIMKFFEKAEGSSQVFAVNRLAQAGAMAVMDNLNLNKKFVQKFLKRKKDFENKLKKIKGIKVFETRTSFCLIKTDFLAKEIKEKLILQNIFVKDCSIFENMDPDLVYLGVPREEDEEEVFEALKLIMNNEW